MRCWWYVSLHRCGGVLKSQEYETYNKQKCKTREMQICLVSKWIIRNVFVTIKSTFFLNHWITISIHGLHQFFTCTSVNYFNIIGNGIKQIITL